MDVGPPNMPRVVTTRGSLAPPGAGASWRFARVRAASPSRPPGGTSSTMPPGVRPGSARPAAATRHPAVAPARAVATRPGAPSASRRIVAVADGPIAGAIASRAARSAGARRGGRAAGSRRGANGRSRAASLPRPQAVITNASESRPGVHSGSGCDRTRRTRARWASLSAPASSASRTRASPAPTRSETIGGPSRTASNGSARRACTAPYGPSSSACTKARTSWYPSSKARHGLRSRQPGALLGRTRPSMIRSELGAARMPVQAARRQDRVQEREAQGRGDL